MSPTDQRHAAAVIANDHRATRARDKANIRRRTLTVSAIVADPSPAWETALLYDVMLAAPKFGMHKLRAFNACAVRQGVNVCAPVGDLPPVGRAFVVDYLRERGL